jgi:hypothetical protein
MIPIVPVSWKIERDSSGQFVLMRTVIKIPPISYVHSNPDVVAFIHDDSIIIEGSEYAPKIASIEAIKALIWAHENNQTPKHEE